MSHPALHETAHRPWPLPARAWAMTMDWCDPAFLHWRVAPASLQRELPDGVQLETFDGSAWLGVVPFRMAATRARWLPPIPTAHAFPELNVRTYVTGGGRSGVWFFSLDATSRLAIAGARWSFGLPYFQARMAVRREGDTVHYRSERSDARAPAATFAARWRAAGAYAAAVPGTLSHFLTERYCLFAQRRGRVMRGDIAHAPWQLAPAELTLDAADVARIVGVTLDGPPESVLVARRQRVAAWWPRIFSEP